MTMASGSQFDSLARLYVDFSELDFRQHLEFPSVFGLIGQVDGQRILDLGCGSGVFARQLAKKGAAAVVGFDESNGMLEFAVQREAEEPLGITYIPGTLPTELHGSFDLVLAIYVLPYARNYDELLALCKSAAAALRPGQRFITSPIHPAINPDPEYYSRYGFRITPLRTLTDAAPVELNLRFSHYDARVTAYYWTAGTLEKALVEAGFTGITWHTYHAAKTDDVDPSFLKPYLDYPHAIIIQAMKAQVPT